MKVRTKLLVSLLLLIVFMGTVYYGISYLYSKNLFSQYVQESQKDYAKQLANYYKKNESWVGIENYINKKLLGEKQKSSSEWVRDIKIYDADHHLLVSFNVTNNSVEGKTQTDEYPILYGGTQVGIVQITGTTPIGLLMAEQQVFRTISFGTLTGIICTSIIALLLGAWLTKIFTRPLGTILQGIQRVKEGDLQTQLKLDMQDEFGEVANSFDLMTQKLYKTEQARTHLVADVAHELRTPLTIIQGQLELIQQGIKPAEPSALLPIQDEVARLTRLVQDLHQLSLAEVGKLPLEKKTVSLHQLLEQITSMYQFEAEERKIQLRFETELEDGASYVQIDPNRITQVIVNLLSNAFAYTPEEGKILVTLEKSLVGGLLIRVMDTGSGIDAEHLPYLFDRFYRADKNRSRQEGGTGLGLAIAKEFVEAHGGTITVASEKGRGTCFKIHVPIKG
ncbi:two-component system, OmpR family, sensor histidine kinase BaeS [Thermoactinomyces sp. DSM 45891]|uniref:HAMP domain-containing sensor histidine kinase n=1 Tax=Thermoactinomyces sp. DSM 45891 TaxID=1761907 RepID=UPI0009154432|nr:ATP-binding protein [Thermoactinomyces sp. DSM 45891]SFX53929.1 two-component system, OmpR family, sensor histidine kinase BaeS [Thermoactinomyces sp. DSM 45891]